MCFNPQLIIGSMQDACQCYNDAINRVLDSWDDKVSESMQVNCIGRLTNAGQDAADAMTQHGNAIADLLSEMQYFALR